MLTIVLLVSPFVYFVLYNIFSNANHFKYAQTIAKHEGFWNFFPALLCSYLYHERYFFFPEYKNYGYDSKVNGIIEYCIRNYLNNNDNVQVRIGNGNIPRIVFIPDIQDPIYLYPYDYSISVGCSIHGSKSMYDYFILPPTQIRLIEKYLREKFDNKDS